MFDTLQDPGDRVVRNSDIHSLAQHQDEFRMENVVGLSVGQMDAERHKRPGREQLFKFFRSHGFSIAL